MGTSILERQACVQTSTLNLIELPKPCANHNTTFVFQISSKLLPSQEMDHLIGQRFNLISKSEIRYLGTLHEINPEQSTIALEDVFSFGTEDRQVDSFIPPSQQKFDYIVFRGSDVKDIKIAEEQNEPKQPSPPSMPNDPAILVSSHLYISAQHTFMMKYSGC
jgi:hypothetical protein